MLPFGHLAVGFACYAGYSLAVRGRLPGRAPTIAVLVGALTPDLIDKPLSYVGVLSSGRSLAHSLAFAAALVAVGWVVARRREDGAVVVAFLVGYLSHLPADGYVAILAGRLDRLGYLFWPVVPASRYALDDVAPWERLADVAATPHVLFQASLVVGVAILWGVLRRRRAGREA